MLDKPVADLSGIQLTWVYFGHSPLYAHFIAWEQLAASILLVFKRTVRLGAAVLLPITADIVMVNFGFRIGWDTEVVATFLLALNLYLLGGEWPAWKRFLWDETAEGVSASDRLRSRAIGMAKGGGLVVALIGLGWMCSFEQQNGAKRSPFFGEWLVESTTLDGREITDPSFGAGWRWICFDADGRLSVSVRANRFTFLGRYSVEGSESKVTLRYDPEPLPPIYPGRSRSARISPADEQRLIGEQLVGFRWPVEVVGTYQR